MGGGGVTVPVAVGMLVGMVVGIPVGIAVGTLVGCAVGIPVGMPVGLPVGIAVGLLVGAPVAPGGTVPVGFAPGVVDAGGTPVVVPAGGTPGPGSPVCARSPPHATAANDKLAAFMPILLSLAITNGWMKPMMTVGLFVLLELVSNNVMEPWIYGTSTGVSPVAVLADAVFWTWV